jgi:hypothetical protein
MRKAIGVLTLIGCLLGLGVEVDAQVQLGAHVGYTHITGDVTTAIKPAPGTLHAVCLNTPVATEIITLFDSLTAAGTVIAVITVPASPQPVCLPYHASFNVGLTVLTATAASDITVTWE